jgi:hypothetical protein
MDGRDWARKPVARRDISYSPWIDNRRKKAK